LSIDAVDRIARESFGESTTPRRSARDGRRSAVSDENETILDQLGDKHELLSLDLNYPECYQVIQVPQDGRDLRAIVPLSFDGTRVGEVLGSAMVGEIAFLLCRHDKDHGDGYGVLGLLVVARPHPDGRHRAVIAHTTFSLERLGLYPWPTSPG
jgi:hypothetical protein